MYIDLETAKKHLIVEHDMDDLIILDYITAAEDAITKTLNVNSLDDITDCNGNLPSSVVQDILFLVGHLYANREPVAYSTVTEVPMTIKFFSMLNRNFDDFNGRTIQ